MKKPSLPTRFLLWKERLAARRKLSELAAFASAGSFSLEFNHRHRQRPGCKNPAPCRQIRFPRLDAKQTKDIEQLLKQAHPELNRKERRDLARGHRWLFQEGLA